MKNADYILLWNGEKRKIAIPNSVSFDWVKERWNHLTPHSRGIWLGKWPELINHYPDALMQELIRINERINKLISLEKRLEVNRSYGDQISHLNWLIYRNGDLILEIISGLNHQELDKIKSILTVCFIGYLINPIFVTRLFTFNNVKQHFISHNNQYISYYKKGQYRNLNTAFDFSLNFKKHQLVSEFLNLNPDVNLVKQIVDDKARTDWRFFYIDFYKFPELFFSAKLQNKICPLHNVELTVLNKTMAKKALSGYEKNQSIIFHMFPEMIREYWSRFDWSALTQMRDGVIIHKYKTIENIVWFESLSAVHLEPEDKHQFQSWIDSNIINSSIYPHLGSYDNLTVKNYKSKWEIAWNKKKTNKWGEWY